MARKKSKNRAKRMIPLGIVNFNLGNFIVVVKVRKIIIIGENLL